MAKIFFPKQDFILTIKKIKSHFSVRFLQSESQGRVTNHPGFLGAMGITRTLDVQ